MTRLLAIVATLTLCAPACGKKGDKPKTDDREAEGAGEAVPAPQAEDPKPTTAATTTLADADLQTPESVLHETVDDVYLISNINGSPLAKDDNGFISRSSPDGKEATRNWIAGGTNNVTLHAPKGMAVLGDTLYVTDIDVVRMFDRATGAPIGEIAIEGATFLNDLTVGDGVVYVSDSGMKAGADGLEPSGADAIYSIDAGGKVTTLIAGDALGRPNGLHYDGKRLWAVTYGSNELYAVSADGKREDVTKLPKGGLDGLCTAVDGTFVISSWEASAIYRGTLSGTFQEIVTDAKSPADIACDAKRSQVVIPLFTENSVRTEQLQKLGEASVRKEGEGSVRKETKCEDLKKQVERAMAALDRSCKADDDCDATGFGCPFGCIVPVRKGANTSIVEKKADRYHDMCGQCKYRCKRMDVACVKNKCTAVEPAGSKKTTTIDLTAP
jgi:sugar lactone lactonase YvrE